MRDTHETFGERLRALRKAKQLTQQALADLVDPILRAADRPGCDMTYLSKIENGRMPPPSVSAIVALAQVLDTPSDELLALAGKAPLDLGYVLTTSPEARAFYRRAQEIGLRADDWAVLQETLDTLDHRDKETV